MCDSVNGRGDGVSRWGGKGDGNDGCSDKGEDFSLADQEEEKGAVKSDGWVRWETKGKDEVKDGRNITA